MIGRDLFPNENYPKTNDGLRAEVGFRIARARKLRDISQKELAKNADLSTFKLSRTERGVEPIKLETLAFIAGYLNADLLYFVEPYMKGTKHISIKIKNYGKKD